jgi:hypothetical protein
VPAAAQAFIEAAPYASGAALGAAAATAAAEIKPAMGQLHVLMPKADLKALKAAALERDENVSDLVRKAVQMYISTSV